MADEKEQEIADLKARLAALERPTAAPTPAARPASPGAQIGCAVVLLIFVAVAFQMCSSSGSSTGGSSTSSGAAANSWTPPEGYSLQLTDRGDKLGVKWDTPKRSECTGSDTTCFALDVVSEKGCLRSLYASITILSKSGENIGWTNDTAQGVQPGEPVRLVFDTFVHGADSARIAEISCY